MSEENRNAVTVDGVRAIEIRYRPILQTGTGDTAFYQSRIRLNAPDMGVLMPERFLPVLENSDRCIPIFLLSLLQIIKAEEKFEGRELMFDWVSVVMPLKILFTKGCVNVLTDFMKKINASPDKLCFEIPSLIFEHNGGEDAMQELRKAGFHTMIAGVDAENFPLHKMSELEPEYVIMNRRVTRMLGTSKRADTCIKSLISFMNDLDAEVVATGPESGEMVEKLYDLGCSYYTADENAGNSSGKFMLERYIGIKR